MSAPAEHKLGESRFHADCNNFIFNKAVNGEYFFTIPRVTGI